MTDDVWPIYTVIADRYGGTYSGAAWLAWQGEERAADEPRLTGVIGGDLACSQFFASPRAEAVGRGDTPIAALTDLLERTTP